MGMLFTCGGKGGDRVAVLMTMGSSSNLRDDHLCLTGWLGPHPQVVKDVADKGDIADPALQGACPQLLPGLVLLLQPVEESTTEDTLACLLTLCL